jgi:hypothetical protein
MELKDLYNENYKILKKEIEEDTKRWKDLPCSRISRINTAKMATLLKCNPHQNCNVIFHRHRRINPKVHMEA